MIAELLAVAALAADRYQPRLEAKVPRQPYERYTTRDRFDRTVTFYLSETGATREPLPLVVYVEGSGCASAFARRGDAVVPHGGHISVNEAAAGRARALVVEKPGVSFLDQPPSCRDAAEFNREHTLERWAEAVEAAIRAVQSLPQVRRGQALVVGHSEGGLVACRVAKDLPAIVTHVATMAGGGPSQLFDLMTLARKGTFFRDRSEDPDARVAALLEDWRAIRARPDAADAFFLGFAYRRWSSFLATSPIEELLQTPAAVFVAQGTDDAAVDPASADMLVSQLLAHGKTPVYDRVAGANHSFRRAASPELDGWRQEIDRILAWFLEEKGIVP